MTWRLCSISLCAVLILASPSATSASSTTQPPPTTEQQFAEATAVFVARLLRTEEAQMVWDGKTEPIVEGTFRVIEVLKGQPPPDQKVRSLVFGPGNCSIQLLAGWDYVFFLYKDSNFVFWPGGSVGTFNIDGTGPKRLLEELRSLAKSANRQ